MPEDCDGLEKLRVLIVEDDRIAARDLEATLKRLGHEVAGVAASGEEALEIAEAKRPDLALIDVRLEGEVDGIDAAGELHGTWKTPVVFLTGYSGESVFARARRVRPAGYLRKPFGDGELAACLDAAIERSEVHEAFGEREGDLRRIIEAIDRAVIASDADGRISLLNAAAEKLTGWTKSKAAGLPLREVVPVAEPEEAESDGEGEERNAGFRTIEIETRSGETIRVSERSAPIRNEKGDLLGLITFLEDVVGAGDSLAEPDTSSDSEGEAEPAVRAPALAKAAELSKQESFRELLGHRSRNGGNSDFAPESETPDDAESDEDSGSEIPLIDEIGDPLLTVDDDLRITYANAEALAYFGGTSPLIGREFWKGFAPRTREKYGEEFRRPLVSGRRHSFEFHDVERGCWLEVNAYPSGGGVLALFHDISDRKQAEADNVRVQRLEGLGLLARGFAHDFNNLLTVLVGNLDLARERFPDDPEFQKEMGNAEDAASHARNLVLQLLTFAQGGRPIREPTRVSDLLRQVLAEHRRRRPDIRFQFQCADPNLRVNLDRGQITRLVGNLVSNSEHAMAEGGGSLIARCGTASGEEVGRWNGAPVPAGEDHLVIEIIDTGRGMSEVELERAFEPYFTTRTGSNATGIGLTVCESIAKAHDGFILLQSKEGRGTIATFCMPLGAPSWADENVDAVSIGLTEAAARQKEPVEAAEKARILVLEDDFQISKLISLTLQKDGHEVVETADGRDTVRVFREAREAGEPFDLILSDLTIEDGIGGVETMRALRRLDPDVVAIVSSGYSDAPAMAKPAAYGFSAVLPKPYPPRELRRLVNAVLANGAGKKGSEISQAGRPEDSG